MGGRPDLRARPMAKRRVWPDEAFRVDLRGRAVHGVIQIRKEDRQGVKHWVSQPNTHDVAVYDSDTVIGI